MGLLQFMFKVMALVVVAAAFMGFVGCAGCFATMSGVSAVSSYDDTRMYEVGDDVVFVKVGCWVKDGKMVTQDEAISGLHSVDGQPGLKSRWVTAWGYHGVIHRDPDAGPALIIHKGTEGRQYYFVHGVPCASKEEAKEVLKAWEVEGAFQAEKDRLREITSGE